jgi:O-acetyl-ADP-ribose deacetylase (regulator of RNase III)
MSIEVASGRTLEIAQGDLTQFAADAIVNAANSALAGGGGVDGAIHRAGGPAIMADLEARYGADRHCPTGSAVVSVAGELPARWLIHAVGPIWRGGGSGEPELLASAYRSVLAHAEQLGAASIAFPAISCGIYGYPLEEGAEVGLSAVAEALRVARTVRHATFVLFSDPTREVFERSMVTLWTATER